jgi:aminoglycoside phosphotransferase family enzyme
MEIPESMKNPEIYDERVEKIEMLQTHISWIFLTGRHAYKVKKPVNFGFLDFSTLDKRKHFCERELEINRKLSPEIYLQVLPITGEGIKGSGEPIEYCIKMRELPQEALMSNQIGKVDQSVIDKIIDILIDFYQKTESGEKINKFGSPETIRFNWNENFEQTEDFIGKTLSREQFDEIRAFVEGFLKDNQELFKKRIDDGRIKWCHGDLHSGNIFVPGGKIYIFDAIEFNERFACSDVASDIAFLAMDLEFRGRKDLVGYFVEKFIEKSNDPEIAKLLDFYKIYRAYVRGKVISFKLNDPTVSEAEKEEASVQAKRYFEYCKSLRN